MYIPVSHTNTFATFQKYDWRGHESPSWYCPLKNRTLLLRPHTGKLCCIYCIHFRHGTNAPVVRTYTNSEISCTESRPFWVYWKEGYIRVGRTHEAFDSQMMTWTDSSPREPNRLTIASSSYSGYWELLGSECWS